ncbi:MAG: hypothetical protein ABJJ37_06240 [Roseibium sp.]
MTESYQGMLGADVDVTPANGTADSKLDFVSQAAFWGVDNGDLKPMVHNPFVPWLQVTRDQ